MLPERIDRSRSLSLYIHVPFCRAKCDYCAFYSVPRSSVDDDIVKRYMDILISEIRALSTDWGKPFRTIFIGGGNPGILGYDRLRTILEEACRNGMAKECTIEINPENVTEEILTLSPFLTRVSVGIQSMDRDTLRTLGRNADIFDNERALSILSSSPFAFNADIMTAVPGSGVETTEEDIKKIASFDPDHISLYCLTFEEGTPLIERARPIGEEGERAALIASWRLLKELGYSHYEVSNFARDGKECLHNKVYWSLGQYIGFGPGAESSIGYSEAVSMKEPETIEEYIRKPKLTCFNLTREETEEEVLLTSLRTIYGIDKGEYSKRFGKDFDALYSERISALDPDCYIDSPDRFSLTEEGFLKLDRIILEMAMAL